MVRVVDSFGVMIRVRGPGRIRVYEKPRKNPKNVIFFGRAI